MPEHTTTTAAIALGITRRRVLKLIQLGRLKATKFGRDWRIEESDIVALNAQPRKAGRPATRPPAPTVADEEKQG